jgi:site-specific DNA recombinase
MGYGSETFQQHTVRTIGTPNGSMRSPLVDKLFDETGDRLTPTHAVKSNRRYRYYVSRSLLKGAAGQTGQGWRIPAMELEHNLAAALSKILQDRSALVHDLPNDHDVARLKSILETVKQWSARFRSCEESSHALASLVERAEVGTGRMRLSIRVPLQASGESSTSGDAFCLKREMALQVRRRGIEMRLVVGAGADPKIDLAILKAIAPANQWLADLLSGRSSSLVEIGNREGVGKRYVSRIVRLAFLAPSIIEEIATAISHPSLRPKRFRLAAAIFL